MAAAVASPPCLQQWVAPGEVDAETLQRARQGDAIALERFIRHYQRSVFAFLSRAWGQGPEVEDLAQEVFLRAYRALPRFEPRVEARTSTWLLKIAVRLVLDTRKRRRVLPALGVVLENIPMHQTPETEQQGRDLLRAFERAAAQLPEEQRVAFVLEQFHGLDAQQIAAVTETKLATVKTRLFRARAHLREMLRTMAEVEVP